MTDLEELKRLVARAEKAEKERDRLRRALRVAAVRLEILCDRMEGCHAETGRHALLDEGRAFAEDTRSTLAGDTPNV